MNRKALLAFAILLPLAGETRGRYQASEPHMGTLVSITLYARNDDEAQRGFTAAFGRIEQLNRIFSDYDPQSELSGVCRAQGGHPVSRELFAVLQFAQKVSGDSDGAFDITAGPLTHLWRTSRRARQLPPDEAIDKARVRSGYRNLRLTSRGRRVECLKAGMLLDAGAIAKGYAADEALVTLRRAGIGSALVAISGDVTMSNPPPGRKGWTVRVLGRTVVLSNAAVSSSGDEFQFLELNGVRYSHILDPRTGRALQDSRAVSVIAKTGIEADALDTAVSVGGEKLADSLRRGRKVQIFLQ